MKQIDNKINNSGGVDGQLTAEEYNDRDNELENAVVKSNQTLTPGAGDDTSQLAKAIANVSQYGGFKFNHGGVADAYTVDTKAEFQETSGIEQGMEIKLVPIASNTGPATLDYNGEGPLLIKDPDGNSLLGGELLTGLQYSLYRKGIEWWIDAAVSGGGGGGTGALQENYLVNPDFFVKSFGESFAFSTITSPFEPKYVADTWQLQLNDDGGLVNSPTQQADVDILPLPYDSLPAQEGGENFLRFSASILGGNGNQYSKISAKIEGVNTLSNDSDKATLSFYAKGSELVGLQTAPLGVAVKKYHGTTDFPPLSIPNATLVRTAQINATQMAWIDDFHRELRTYEWSGSSWSQVGNALPIAYFPGDGVASIAPVSTPDTIVLVFTTTPADPIGAKHIFTYQWDGTDWTFAASAPVPGAVAGGFNPYTVIGFPYDIFGRFGSGGPDSIVITEDSRIYSLQGTASTASWTDLDPTPPISLVLQNPNHWDGLSSDNIVSKESGGSSDLVRYENTPTANSFVKNGFPVALPFVGTFDDALCTMVQGPNPAVSPTFHGAISAIWSANENKLYALTWGPVNTFSAGTAIAGVSASDVNLRRISDNLISLWDEGNKTLRTFFWNGIDFVESSDAPSATTSYTMQDLVTLTPDWQKFVVTGDYQVLQEIKENNHAAVEFFRVNGIDNVPINGVPEIDVSSVPLGKVDIANVQIIRGLASVPYVAPNRATQIDACKRFFQKIYLDSNTPFTWRATNSTIGAIETRTLDIPMRGAPEVRYFNNGVEADIDMVNGQVLNNAAAANDGIIDVLAPTDGNKIKIRISGAGFTGGTFYGHTVDNDSEIWLDAGYYLVE